MERQKPSSPVVYRKCGASPMLIDYEALLEEALELEAETLALLEKIRTEVNGENPPLTNEIVS